MEKKTNIGLSLTLLFCIFTGIIKQNNSTKEIFSKEHFFNEISMYSAHRKVIPRVKYIDKIGVNIFDFFSKIRNHVSFKEIDLSKKINSYNYQLFISRRAEQFNEVIQSKKGLQSSSKEITYMVNPMPVWKEICRDSLDLFTPTPRYQIIAGRGEWESMQLAITPINKSIDSVYIKIIKWPFYEKPQVFWGEYVFCKWSANHHKDVTVQDLLIPMNEDNYKYTCDLFPAKIKNDSTKSVWLNFDFTSKKIEPGKYLAEVEIHTFHKGIENETYSIPLDIEISSFQYPENRRLKTLISYSNFYSNAYYGSKEYVEKKLENHYSVLSDFKIFPMNVWPEYCPDLPKIEEWNNLYNKGARIFMLESISNKLFLDSSKFRNEMLNDLKEKEEFLVKNDLIDYSYIFLFDEIVEDQKAKLIKTAEILKENGIRSKLYATTDWVPPTHLIDAWCPLLQTYDKKIDEFDSKNFKQRFVYTCNTTLGEKYGNFFTDMPFIQSRRVFWNLYERNIDYYQYYAVNRWDKNIHRPIHKILNRKKGTLSWKTASYRNQNGDGQLFYPGDNGEMWPSVRAFNFRDGIEDYELFYKNKKKINSEKISEILKERKKLLRNKIL